MNSKKLLLGGGAALVLLAAAGGTYVFKDKPPISTALAFLTGPGGAVLATGTAAPGAPGAPTSPGAAAAAAPTGSTPTTAPAGSGAAQAAKTSAAAPPAPAPQRQVIEGTFIAETGDTLLSSILGARVHLKGVIAPPMSRPGVDVDNKCSNVAGAEEDLGLLARAHLGVIVEGLTVSCAVEADGAICTLPDGREVNRVLAEQGWAVGKAGGVYEAVGDAARAANRGIFGVCASAAK